MNMNRKDIGSITKRLLRALLWYWLICFTTSITIFVTLFWGALVLPDQLYLFMAHNIAYVNLAMMGVLFLGASLFAPNVSQQNETISAVAALMNMGWLFFSLSLGPFFLYRYHSLPPSDLKEFYYYSYLASYLGASFVCALSNGLFLILQWRVRFASNMKGRSAT
jgi:hypothetical protein